MPDLKSIDKDALCQGIGHAFFGGGFSANESVFLNGGRLSGRHKRYHAMLILVPIDEKA